MKIIKLISVMFALTLVCNRVQGQVTPEAIIGQCPDLPSAAYLAADSDNQAASAAIEAFHEKIQKLRETSKSTDNAMWEAAKQDAERIAQQMTGKSVTQLQNMSEADQKAFAQQMVNQKLSASGLGNLSLAQLQALEGKSNDEIAAAMTASGATFGGLTPSEINAMENMTEEQAAVYLQEGNRMQRMQAATNSPQVKKQQTQTKKIASQVEITNEMKKITDRWQEIDRLNERETREVAAQFPALYQKHGIDAAFAAASPCMDGKVDTKIYTKTYCDAAAKRLAATWNAYYTECYTLWRNQVSKMQGRIKTKMADVARYDELLAQSMNIGGMTATAKEMPSIGFSIAGQYLDATSSVTTLPKTEN
ncbi:MAG: hypothetical protein FWF52_09565 [Candidatus Azobacteroides sp.]|nr:hypothetical protein [Candidatus Azobacteroides sp.]